MKDMSKRQIEQHWTAIAQKQLLGKCIVSVRYMTSAEMKAIGWYRRSLVLGLEDGSTIWVSSDDEGNNAGALFTSDQENSVLPVLS